MAQVINTNMASLNAQRNLSTSQTALATSLQRLSSGLRINSAKDDAAGMAISDRMTSQIRGLNQAARNANDGISLAQTAEGSLNAISDNLQRLRELAVQSSNASNSASDRASMNAEATQLVAEIDRVASTTQFNGVNLLDGSFQSQKFQVGANAGQTIAVDSIGSAKSNALGVGSGSSYSTNFSDAAGLTTLTATTSVALTAGGVVINGHNVGKSSSDGVSSVEADSSGIAKAAAINAVAGDTGVTASVGVTTSSVFTATAAGTATAGTSVNGVLIGNAGAVTLSTDAKAAASEMAAAINAVSNQTGVTATATGATYKLTAADGRNIDVVKGTAGSSGIAANETDHSAINLSSASVNGITLGGAQVGEIGAAAGKTDAISTVGAGVSSVDLSTASGATAALTVIDSALATINASRGALGAYQNRFASAVSNLATTAENLTASRSRIQDTDFAAETAAMTRGQILQQAGTAILAQANSLPNSVLSLLK